MADKKLRIPGPAEHEDLTQLDNSIFYGLMFCVLVGGLLALYTKRQAEEAEQRAAQSAPRAPRTDLEAKQRELIAAHADDPDAHDWRGQDAIAVLRYGPRRAAEAACRDAFAAEDELDRAIRIELLGAVNRDADHAPWVCLTRAYLDGSTKNSGQLHDELAAHWENLTTFKASPAVAATVVEAFDEDGAPDNRGYRDWLYLCAFHPSTPGEQCRASLQATADASTLLGLFDAMLRRFHDLARVEAALINSIEGLASLAKTGDLEGWDRPKNISARDVQLGTVFWMCRLVHAPDEELAWAAASGLSDVGSMAVRAGDENLVPRWRQACQLAFQDGGTDRAPRAPALAVWSGTEGEPPAYTLREARQRGDCVAPDDAPPWMCGPAAWRGSGESDLQTELMDFFTKTRWLEWRD
ncbi:MAG: hypothetical protein ACQEVA_05695 [Myxococcota bacterium]